MKATPASFCMVIEESRYKGCDQQWEHLNNVFIAVLIIRVCMEEFLFPEK